MDNAGTRSHGPNAAQLIALHTLQPTARSHEVARMAMLDCLACIVAGSATAPARMALDLALAQGARGVAAVLGTRERLAPAPAAFANGVAGHALDFDDMTAIMIGHPSVVLVPAILALAQSRGLGAGAVLDAYVAGFEYATWFGRRMIPAHYDAGWHSTSSIGVFGATAASARLLGLDAESTLNALAIAASGTCGLRANFGSMTKSLHAGQAAETGVRAALLSAGGFTANSGLFDDAGGFFDLYGIQSPQRYTLADGALEIDTTGIGLKPYACCGAGVSAMDAAIDTFVAHAPGADDIVAIDCRVSHMATRIMPYTQAADGFQAKYCLPYCVAVALLDGRGAIAQFEDTRVARDDVQRLMQRVRVTADGAMAQGEGRFGIELRTSLANGRVLVESLDMPRGHPGRPLSDAELGAKFIDCAAPVLGDAQAARALAAVRALERLDGISALVELLCPASK